MYKVPIRVYKVPIRVYKVPITINPDMWGGG